MSSQQYSESYEQQYADIINQPRPEPQNHRRMPLRDRAAQFAPFSALTGYEAVVQEAARQTSGKIELAEDAQVELDGKLRCLLEHNLTAEFTYFIPDEHKSGGEYRKIRGRVLRVSPLKRLLVLDCGVQLPLADIVEIHGEDIESE